LTRLALLALALVMLLCRTAPSAGALSRLSGGR
jgi:hypothetical protein